MSGLDEAVRILQEAKANNHSLAPVSLPEADRETIRNELYSLAQRIRADHKLSPIQIRKLLHQMIDVSV